MSEAFDFSRHVDTVRHWSKALMPETCQVVRMVPGGRDEYGDPIGEVEAIVATVPCKLSPIGADEEVAAGQLAASSSGKVALPWGTSVLSSDTLRVDGRDYNVAGVLERGSGHAPHIEILVSRSA